MKKTVLMFVLLLSAMTMSAQKFALLDMEYILKNIPAYERANEQLDQVSKKWQAEVEALNTEASTMYKNYQNEIVYSGLVAGCAELGGVDAPSTVNVTRESNGYAIWTESNDSGEMLVTFIPSRPCDDVIEAAVALKNKYRAAFLESGSGVSPF